MLGKKRKSLLDNLLERISAICLGKVEEHTDHAVQHGAGTLVSSDYVLECRSLLVCYDSIDLSLMLSDSFLDCRKVILLADCTEIRNSIRGIPLLGKNTLWIFRLLFSILTCNCCHNYCCKQKYSFHYLISSLFSLYHGEPSAFFTPLRSMRVNCISASNFVSTPVNVAVAVPSRTA